MTLRGILAVLLGVSVLFVAPVTVLLAMQGETTGGLEPSEVVRNWTQVVQGVATVAALVVGGLWTYRIFFVGGGASAHMQIQLKLKQVIDVGESKGAVISVELKNLGRTSVKETQCQIGVVQITELDPINLKIISGSLGKETRWEALFVGVLPRLEPNEEVAEDFIVTLSEGKEFIKMEAQVTGSIVGLFGPTLRDPPWSSRAIFDVRPVEDAGWAGGTNCNEERRAQD